MQRGWRWHRGAFLSYIYVYYRCKTDMTYGGVERLTETQGRETNSSNHVDVGGVFVGLAEEGDAVCGISKCRLSVTNSATSVP